MLGPIRVLWVAPRLGERTAELLEMPLMLVAIVLAARWIARRFGLPTLGSRALAGAVALGLLLLAELTVVWTLRGLTLAEYLAGRDPVAGGVYAAMLLIFATMPALLLAYSNFRSFQKG